MELSLLLAGSEKVLMLLLGQALGRLTPSLGINSGDKRARWEVGAGRTLSADSELGWSGFPASCPLVRGHRGGSCTIKGKGRNLAGGRRGLTMSGRPAMSNHHTQGPVWQRASCVHPDRHPSAGLLFWRDPGEALGTSLRNRASSLSHLFPAVAALAGSPSVFPEQLMSMPPFSWEPDVWGGGGRAGHRT